MTERLVKEFEYDCGSCGTLLSTIQQSVTTPTNIVKVVRLQSEVNNTLYTTPIMPINLTKEL